MEAPSYFKPRREYLGDCWKHARQNWAVAMLVFASTLYSVLTAIQPFVDVHLFLFFMLPKLPLVWAAVIALAGTAYIIFEGGYRLWREEQEKRRPKFEIVRCEILLTPVSQSNVHQTYVQVVPKCTTNAPVSECKGYLLRVYKNYGDEENWQATGINEPLDLQWSIHGSSPLTLQPGIDQRLNVCFWNHLPTPTIILATDFRPMLWTTVPNPTGTFRFEIRVTARDCPPVDISVDVKTAGCEWDKPIVKLTQGFTNFGE